MFPIDKVNVHLTYIRNGMNQQKRMDLTPVYFNALNRLICGNMVT